MGEYTLEGGDMWVAVCLEWWSAFAASCSRVWQTAFLDGYQVDSLHATCVKLGGLHRKPGFPIVLWLHIWCDHLYVYARTWRTLSRFACFGVEGSHRRLKRMLRNSGGVSALKGRGGLQVVVDNHTIDDSLLQYGWDVGSRAGRVQAGARSVYWKTRAKLRHANMSVTAVALARVQARSRKRASMQ